MIKLIVVLLIVGLTIYGGLSLQEDIENDEVKTYEGPVPKGFSLEHFKNTGETIKEGLNNG